MSPGSSLGPLSDLLRLLRSSSSFRPGSSGCPLLPLPCLPTDCPPLLLPCLPSDRPPLLLPRLPTDCPDAPEEALGGRALGLSGSGALAGRSSLQQHHSWMPLLCMQPCILAVHAMLALSRQNPEFFELCM